MNDDPTIARIRAVRHQISEQYQHDVQRLIDHYIEREQQHPSRFIELTAYIPSEGKNVEPLKQKPVETAQKPLVGRV